ncbi:hypothetical protein AOL_s00004g93 [Orbilia oligospora ATCC 24927]|uniref:Uncharacterized protein n=1 Tax=Arthrobotrys oligospora (strain ATCC 24927 / CBS 115.81 / DSM 1491) TaxID=756982 RepID=G1WXT3_ARTOA|nr:hypothetical protein AOL_s00004g93 [Orbilia oligospora ATCC 24927]EGX54060.1 hypothetical protein AOL_s00004g93 [Orbilia oligospora ATCC 24927]
MGNKHSKDVYIGKDASKGAGEDDDKNTDKDTKKDSAKGNNKNPGKDSPFRYKEPTYKERRRNRLPNWFCISDTIGQPYRLDLLRFYFDRSDPQSLVKQLQKHWMAGLIVWRCPSEALHPKHDRFYKVRHMTGKIYLIGWDEMPNELVDKGVWCGAIYPTEFANIARLYVRCPELWDYDWRHSSFWTAAPQPQLERVRKRIQNEGSEEEVPPEKRRGINEAYAGQPDIERVQSYLDLQRDVHEWLNNTEDPNDFEGEETPPGFSEPLIELDSEGSPSDTELASLYAEEMASPCGIEDPYSHITYATRPPRQTEADELEEGNYISNLATWNLEYKSVPYHKWPEEVFAADLAEGLQRAVARFRNRSYTSFQGSTSSIDIYSRCPQNPETSPAKGAYATPAHSIYIPQITNITSDWSLEVLANLPTEMGFSDPAETVLDYRLPKSYNEMKYPDWEPGFGTKSPGPDSAGPQDVDTTSKTESHHPISISPTSPSSFPSFDSTSSDTQQDSQKQTVRFAIEEKEPSYDELEANTITKADLIPTTADGFYSYSPTVDWLHSEYRHLVQTGNIPKENLTEIMIYGSRGFINLFSRHIDACEFVPSLPEKESRKVLLRKIKDSIRNNPIEEEGEVVFLDYLNRRLDVEINYSDPKGARVSFYEPEEDNRDFSEPLPEEFLIPELCPYTLEKRSGILRYFDSIVDDWYDYGHYDFWEDEGQRFRNDFLLRALAVHPRIGPPDNPYYHEYESFLQNPLIRYYAKLMEMGWPLPSEEDEKKMKENSPSGLTVCINLWGDDEYEWERDNREAEERERGGRETSYEEQGEEGKKTEDQVVNNEGEKDEEEKENSPKQQDREKGKKIDSDLLKLLLLLPRLRRRKQLQLRKRTKGELDQMEISGLAQLQEEKAIERPIWARDPRFPAQDEERERWLSPEESDILQKMRRDAEYGRLRHWRWWYERNRKKLSMLTEWYKMVDCFWQDRAAAQGRADYRRKRRDEERAKCDSRLFKPPPHSPPEEREQQPHRWDTYGFDQCLPSGDEHDTDKNLEPEEDNYDEDGSENNGEGTNDQYDEYNDDDEYDGEYDSDNDDEYDSDYDSDSYNDDEYDSGDWNAFPIQYGDEIIGYKTVPSYAHHGESSKENDPNEAESYSGPGKEEHLSWNQSEEPNYYSQEREENPSCRLRKYVPEIECHDPEIEKPVFYDPEEFKNIRQFPVWREKVYYHYPHKTYSSRPPASIKAQARYWKWLCKLH